MDGVDTLPTVCQQCKTTRTKQNYLPHARNYVKEEAEIIDICYEHWKSGRLRLEVFFLVVFKPRFDVKQASAWRG